MPPGLISLSVINDAMAEYFIDELPGASSMTAVMVKSCLILPSALTNSMTFIYSIGTPEKFFCR